MSSPQIQTSLNAGEISPELFGETDLAKFGSAASTLRNCIVSYKGGAISRAGTAHVGRCKQSVSGTGPPRAITFQFSITQGYGLEFGDNYLRFVFMGGYILENAVAITGITNASPAVASVSGTPFANGDWVFVSGVHGMTEVNGNTYIVALAGSGHFALHDLDGNAVNSSAFAAYTSGGTAARLYTVATPYLAIDLPYLKFAQSADVMSLTCANPITGNEYPAYDLTRFAATHWELTETSFAAGIDPPATLSASANAQAPVNGVNATFAYQVTAVDDRGNESVASPTATCHGADIEVEAGTNTITWAYVTGARYYNVYRAPPAVDTGVTPNPVPAGSIFGYVGSAYGTQFLDNIAGPDLSQTPPTHRDPFARGQIVGVDITDGGSGLSDVSYAITTVDGADFIGYPVVVGGSLGAFPVVGPGHDYEPGDSIAFNGVGFATGAIIFTINPSNGDTITLNGVVWTFVVTVSGPNETAIGAGLADTLSALVADLSASVDPLLTVAAYVVDVTQMNLIITYKTPGVDGNSYTLAASAATPSGATLTGGSGSIGDDPTGTLLVGPIDGTYPGVVAYFQQRRFYGYSFNEPDTFWATQTGRYWNMDVHSPARDTDAITANPWTEQVNGLQALIPMPGGLIALTGSRAWQILGAGSYQLNAQPVTPATTQAQPQAFNGCSATVPPIVIEFDILYVEAVGTTVRDLSWNALLSIYTGADLTILSSHLFLYEYVVQWAWARQPYKVIWACRNDGTMISLSYLKEQEVYGWARSDTQGLVVSVTSVTEPPVNAPYLIVERFTPANPDGVYLMERMDDRMWKTVEDAYAVDSGVSNPMTRPATFVTASAALGTGVTFKTGANTFVAGDVGKILRMGGGIARITHYVGAKQVTGDWVLAASNSQLGYPFSPAGAWTIAAPITSIKATHLAGMSVVALADGVPLTDLTVGADGVVTLPFAASDVKVGLGFTAQVQTVYLNGGQPTTQGRRKVIPAATVRVASSGPFEIGVNQPDGSVQNPPQIAPLWTNMSPATEQQQGAVTYTSPGGRAVTQLWTGDVRREVAGDWAKPGQVAVQQRLPMALEVTALIPEVLEGDLPETGYSPQPRPAQPRTPGRWMLQGAPRI